MKTKFLKTLSEQCNQLKNARIVVACSGGADSMCLLHLLLTVRNELGIKLEAAHVNHGIRGAEADSDEDYVRAFCDGNNIILHSLKVSVPDIAEKTSESIELCARRIRYEFFDSLNADYVATAHTASDRIETMLMNLVRGSSLSGLCSIPAVRGNIIRPLIDFTREDIENYCKINSLIFVTDSTNLTDEYTRNKFRHNVVSQLKIINPAFEKNAVKCIKKLNEENDYLNELAENAYNACLNEDNSIAASALIEQHPVLRKRIIKLFFEKNSTENIESKHIDYIDDNLGTEFSLMLPSSVKVSLRKNRLFIDIKKPSDSVSTQIIDISKDIIIRLNKKSIRIEHTFEKPQNAVGCYVADYNKINSSISLRARSSGDYMHLPKRRCTKSLKKLFNELKIPVEERDSLIVLSDDNGLIFVETVGFDSMRACDSHTTEYLLIKVEENRYE